MDGKGSVLSADEKYSIVHRCKNKELQVLVVDDEAGEEEMGEEEVGDQMELSLIFVMGLTTSHTMKIKGVIAH